KGITEKGIKRLASEQAENNAERKGWDGTVKGGSIVKDMSRVHCAGGTCTIDAIVEVDGKTYEAVITGAMKRGL
ncbi:MAG: hypothetical protein ABJB86_23170, partial [Bacteroidota bacterium]